VFFVHNRVGTIYGMYHLLCELVPEVAFGVAHGQMKGHELEKVMLAFTEKRIQCLVSTMIIESGIDVPNANTLIVNRADRLGLSQLYQLRGRVGRSTQQAFAYFLVPPLQKLTRNAIKRLQTIQEYSHLGSGYKIAMRDLEIRGAGNIFGAEQSGFIDALGFELYAKIIEEAIQELRGPALETKEEQVLPDSRIDIEMETLLPADYVPAASDRVDIYRRLIEARDARQIETIRKEVVDRFGPLPEPAENLVDYLLLKEVTRRAKVEDISIRDGKLSGKFSTRMLPKGEQFKNWVGKMVAHSPHPFELKQIKNELYFEYALAMSPGAMVQAKNFLQNII